jgi:hypothetical protein
MSQQETGAVNLIASNDQVLTYYDSKLTTTDLNTYLAYADKLRAWLKSERAYYPAARPKVRVSSPPCGHPCCSITSDASCSGKDIADP